MNILIFFLLLSSLAWGKPIVLLSYFDAFNRAPFNNSQNVAKALAQRLNNNESPVIIKLCALNTIFDKAYAQTEECLKVLSERPIMVIGLGETGCMMKIETIMRNKDKTKGPDNAGNFRHNTRIIPEAPDRIGLKYPLPQMYCALTSVEKNNLIVSNDAGTFVCNNTAFQMSYHYSDIQYGFIHVPSHSCPQLAQKTEATVSSLSKMIQKGVTYLSNNEGDFGLPHSSNETRLPTERKELIQLRNHYRNQDQCIEEFISRY